MAESAFSASWRDAVPLGPGVGKEGGLRFGRLNLDVDRLDRGKGRAFLGLPDLDLGLGGREGRAGQVVARRKAVGAQGEGPKAKPFGGGKADQVRQRGLRQIGDEQIMRARRGVKSHLAHHFGTFGIDGDGGDSACRGDLVGQRRASKADRADKAQGNKDNGTHERSLRMSGQPRSGVGLSQGVGPGIGRDRPLAAGGRGG